MRHVWQRFSVRPASRVERETEKDGVSAGRDLPEAKLPAGDAQLRALQDRLGNRGLLRAMGSGQVLPNPLRNRFERSLTTSLSDVRIHSDHAAAAMAQQFDARAFTFGKDIYLGPGASIGSPGGESLLAHEVAHVAQQARGGVAPGDAAMVSQPHDSSEREADAAAHAMIAGGPARVTARPLAVARQPTGPGGGTQPAHQYTYGGFTMPPLPSGELQYDASIGQLYFDTADGRWYMGPIGRTQPWFVPKKPQPAPSGPKEDYDPLLRQFYTENEDGSRDYWGPIGATNGPKWHRPKLELEQPIGLFGNFTNPARILQPGYRMWEGNFAPNIASTGDYSLPLQLSYRQTLELLGTNMELGAFASVAPGSGTSGNVGATLRLGPTGKDEGWGLMLQPNLGILKYPSGNVGTNPGGLAALERTWTFGEKLQWDTDVLGSGSQYYQAGERWANPFLSGGIQSQLTYKPNDWNNIAIEGIGLGYGGRDTKTNQWFGGGRWGAALGYSHNWLSLTGRDPATPEGYDTNSVSVYLSYVQDKFPGEHPIRTVTLNVSLGELRRILSQP
jgi:hypothetical protein